MLTKTLEERNDLFRSIEDNVVSIISYENKGYPDNHGNQNILPESFYIIMIKQKARYLLQSVYYVKDIGGNSNIKKYSREEIWNPRNKDVFSDSERRLIFGTTTDGCIQTTPALETKNIPQNEIDWVNLLETCNYPDFD